MSSDLTIRPEIFIPAEPEYYATWVFSHLLAGGHVDNFRSGLPADFTECLYATEDFELGDERGSSSKSIIVPEGVRQSGLVGHNSLYLFDGPQAINAHGISAYAIPEFSGFATLYVLTLNEL